MTSLLDPVYFKLLTIESEFEIELFEVPHAAAYVEVLPSRLTWIELDVMTLNFARESTGVLLQIKDRKEV